LQGDVITLYFNNGAMSMIRNPFESIA